LNILFVSSGNNKDGLSPIVRNQGESLIRNGVQIIFFTINGKGFKSYFLHIFKLRKFLKQNKFDIIHAHYTYSAYVAALSGAKPLIVSLMGSDVISKINSKFLLQLFCKLFAKQIIVKSLDMYQCLKISEAEIIPNGVDIEKFKSIEKEECLVNLGWDISKIHILFAADPTRPEKNFSLTQKALTLLKLDYDIVLHLMQDLPHEIIPVYMNASDVIILSSLHEGSPNVIKEAMSCNCSIVATDVGDIRLIIGETEGCYLSSFDPEDMAEKIHLALQFSNLKGKTNGRQKIITLGLDSDTVAHRIIKIYKSVRNTN